MVPSHIEIKEVGLTSPVFGRRISGLAWVSGLKSHLSSGLDHSIISLAPTNIATLCGRVPGRSISSWRGPRPWTTPKCVSGQGGSQLQERKRWSSEMRKSRKSTPSPGTGSVWLVYVAVAWFAMTSPSKLVCPAVWPRGSLGGRPGRPGSASLGVPYSRAAFLGTCL